MIPDALRPLWTAPRPPGAPARVWRDWVLVVLLVPTAVLETLHRNDVPWKPASLAVALVTVVAVLWRRTHPLAVTVVVFGSLAVVDAAALVAGVGEWGLYASVCLLLVPYALVRWGSGREIVLGLGVVLVALALGIAGHWTGIGDAVLEVVFLLSPAGIGAWVRYGATARLREQDQVRLREREQLARELHDTVAHHVSAIAVRAQAGRVVAATDPQAALDALRLIETEASRALTEMRLMVGALRDGAAPELAPQQGIADLERLARAVGGPPRVELELSGDLDDLRPAVGVAVYRLAQESITNALRHARHASRIDVRLVGDDDSVRLTVVDDGEAPTRTGTGYGLVGMTERAALLGGTLDAGPGPDRGWAVAAVLPKVGAVR